MWATVEWVGGDGGATIMSRLGLERRPQRLGLSLCARYREVARRGRGHGLKLGGSGHGGVVIVDQGGGLLHPRYPKTTRGPRILYKL